MKTHLFLIAVMLLVRAETLPAQTPATKPSPPAPAASASIDADDNIFLPPDTLGHLIHDYIEVKLMPEWRDHIGHMPNILMTQEVSDIEVPALRLHHVSPLQAVALAAAAADCSLVPILDPTPATGGHSMAQAAIGYRIIRNKTAGSDSGQVPLTVPAETAVSSRREEAPVDTSRRFIRVHALGSSMSSRSADEIKRGDTGSYSTSDEQAFLEIMHSALETLESVPPPDLMLHAKSKVLVVRANAAQQEIVEQVIKALKENKEAEPRMAGEGKP
ncbi:hypothetical protein [Prosthecobacter fluviatilis]|uniref:Uncharacterized protein n=1 Tax=Prosthecobacter fluviatilis TaxID=445931 RepID=A0ABW0KIM4_9BACT